MNASKKTASAKAPAAVDYPMPDAKNATEAAKVVGAVAVDFRKHGDEGDALTIRCAQATRVAMRTGYLVDGRSKDKDRPGTVTKAGFSTLFGPKASPSVVSYWITLAHALRVRVQPGDGIWQVLTGSHKVGQRTWMTKAAAKAKSKGDLVRAMAENGIDPVTGAKATTTDPKPRETGEKGDHLGTDTGEKGDNSVILTPVEAAAKAMEILRGAVKSPTFQAEEWTALRGDLHRFVASEDRRRGLGATRQPGRKTTKAASKAPVTPVAEAV